MDAAALPVLLIGAGNMGGALFTGWMKAGVFSPSEIWIRDPNLVECSGARMNPPDADLARARTVILAVKPQVWRAVAETVAPLLRNDALVISIMAGVSEAALAAAFQSQQIARVMPTTAAALNIGAASVWASDHKARARARDLFEPLGVVVDLNNEGLMHVATAASGSAPAYVYALTEALQRAAEARGIDRHTARAMSRSAVIGAAALLRETDEDAAVLRGRVTSPGGTTAAALAVLMDPDRGFTGLLDRAVEAAARRSEALSQS